MNAAVLDPPVTGVALKTVPPPRVESVLTAEGVTKTFREGRDTV